MTRKRAAVDKPIAPPEARVRPLPALDLAPFTEEPDDREAPPLRAKLHPPADMSDAKPALDDEVRGRRQHPNDAGATEFAVDPDAADAAADLAGDLGSAFLAGATRGEDMSDLTMAADEAAEEELSLVLDEDADTPVDDAVAPSRRRRVRRP